MWYRYAFQYSAFDDYPKMGVWPDAYYETFNMFNGENFIGSEVCAYDRNQMLTGQAATQVCFQQGSMVGGLLPSDIDGTTAPPPGSPNYVLNFGTNVAQPVQVSRGFQQSRQLHIQWPNGNSRGRIHAAVRRSKRLRAATRNHDPIGFARRPADVSPGVSQFWQSRVPGGQPIRCGQRRQRSALVRDSGP